MNSPIEEQGAPARPRQVAPAEGVSVIQESKENREDYPGIPELDPADLEMIVEEKAGSTETAIVEEQKKVVEYAKAAGEMEPEEAILTGFGLLVHRTKAVFKRFREHLAAPRLEDEPAKPSSETKANELEIGAAEQAFFKSAPGSFDEGNVTKPRRGSPEQAPRIPEGEPSQGFAAAFLEISKELAEDTEDRERSIGELVEAKDADGLRSLLEQLMKEFETALRAKANESRSPDERATFWERKLGAPQKKSDPRTIELLKKNIQRVGQAIVAIEQPELAKPKAEPKAAPRVEAPASAATEIKLEPQLEALRKETLAAVENRLRELDALAASSEIRTKSGITLRTIEAEAAILLDHKEKLKHGEIPLDAVRLRIAALEDELRNLKKTSAAKPEAAAAPRATEAPLDEERTALFEYLTEPYELTEAETVALPRTVEKTLGKTVADRPGLILVSDSMIVEAREPEAALSYVPHPALEAVSPSEFGKTLKIELEAAKTERPTIEVPVFDLKKERVELAYQKEKIQHIEYVARWLYLKDDPTKMDPDGEEFVKANAYIHLRGKDSFWVKYRARITSAEQIAIYEAIRERARELEGARGAPAEKTNDKAAE